MLEGTGDAGTIRDRERGTRAGILRLVGVSVKGVLHKLVVRNLCGTECRDMPCDAQKRCGCQRIILLINTLRKIPALRRLGSQVRILSGAPFFDAIFQ